MCICVLMCIYILRIKRSIYIYIRQQDCAYVQPAANHSALRALSKAFCTARSGTEGKRFVYGRGCCRSDAKRSSNTTIVRDGITARRTHKKMHAPNAAYIYIYAHVVVWCWWCCSDRVCGEMESEHCGERYEWRLNLRFCGLKYVFLPGWLAYIYIWLCWWSHYSTSVEWMWSRLEERIKITTCNYFYDCNSL